MVVDPAAPSVVRALDDLSRQLGGARWAACWHDGEQWRVTSSAPSLRDELLLRLAADGTLGARLDGAPSVIDTDELGDVGNRLRAGGVVQLLASRHHDGTYSVFENPPHDQAALMRMAAFESAATSVAPGERALRDLRALAGWQRVFDDLAAGRRAMQEVLAVLRESGGPVLGLQEPDEQGQRGLEVLDARGATPETLAVLVATLRRGYVVPDATAGLDNAMLRERARLASVIHEGITQSLTTVALQLDTLGFVLDSDPQEAGVMVAAARAAVVDALDGLRSIIVDLTPPEEPWTDLVGGLQRFAADYGSQWGTAVEVNVVGTPRVVDAQVTSLVFAVVQEGLTNVRKHTRATSAQVRISFGATRLVVEVSDTAGSDGAATPAPDAAGLRRHQGLAIMRSRARLLGGLVEFTTDPARGSTLRLTVPA